MYTCKKESRGNMVQPFLAEQKTSFAVVTIFMDQDVNLKYFLKASHFDVSNYTKNNSKLFLPK